MTKVLFVCTGNICRSPMAESVFWEKVRARGLEGRYSVDSAGTGGWHEGEEPDPRTIEKLREKGLDWLTRARQVRCADFDDFDHILALDSSHNDQLRNWINSDPDKVSLLLSWDPESKSKDVPDPYYGGPEGFEHIYVMIDAACQSLLDHLEASSQV